MKPSFWKNFLTNSYIGSIVLFGFLLISVFFISCGGISIGIMTLGIGLIVTIPGSLWIIYKILVIIFGRRYIWRFLLEIISLILLVLTPITYLFSEVLMNNLPVTERIKLSYLYYIILIFIYLFGAYRFHSIYQKSQKEKSLSDPNYDEEKEKEKIAEMENILKNTDISKIGKHVDFITKSGTKYSYEQENLIKIAKYIVDTLGKNTFESEELNTTFLHLQKYLPQAVSDLERALIINEISHFVKEGGTVEFNL